MVCIGVDVLTGVNSTLLADTMTNLEFMMMTLLSAGVLCFRSEALSGWCIAASSCRPLQARMPSCHVCSTFTLPKAPQLPNQEPPRPQQLILPDFWVAPHLAHVESMVFVIAAAYSHVENCLTAAEYSHVEMVNSRYVIRVVAI